MVVDLAKDLVLLRCAQAAIIREPQRLLLLN